MTRIVFLDTETSGIRPDAGAEIWELAAVVRDITELTETDRIRKLHDDEYVWHFRPLLAQADPFALRVGGYYERCSVRGLQPGAAKCITEPGSAPDGDRPLSEPATVAAGKVARLLDGAHLIAANPAFDAGHLDALLRKHGECLTVDYHYTDVGSLVRGWALGSFAGADVPFPLKLDAAAKLARVDPDAYDRHSALGDARLVRDIYDAVTGGAQ